jgi:hypothetical protein
VQVAFYHTAGGDGNVGPGWYIDDLELWRGVPTLVQPESFELGLGDWTTDGGLWQIGLPTSGPGAAHDGQLLAATVLDGNYPRETDSNLISPEFTVPNLPPGQLVQLHFWQWYSYSNDFGRVYIRHKDASAQTWTDTLLATPAMPSSSSNWAPISTDLSPYKGEQAHILFNHTAGGDGNVGPGWYIDQVEVIPDGLGPAVFARSFNFETSPQTLRVDFSEDVLSSLSFLDLNITNTTTNQPVPPFTAWTLNTTNVLGVTRATVTFNPVLADARYRLTIPAGAIQDASGNALASDFNYDFFFLRGDANHDGTVNLADFNRLASNFGQSNRTFSQGDFNYDGLVNLGDFNILASRFGTALNAASASARPTPLFGAKGITDSESDALAQLLN